MHCLLPVQFLATTSPPLPESAMEFKNTSSGPAKGIIQLVSHCFHMWWILSQRTLGGGAAGHNRRGFMAEMQETENDSLSVQTEDIAPEWLRDSHEMVLSFFRCVKQIWKFVHQGNWSFFSSVLSNKWQWIMFQNMKTTDLSMVNSLLVFWINSRRVYYELCKTAQWLPWTFSRQWTLLTTYLWFWKVVSCGVLSKMYLFLSCT